MIKLTKEKINKALNVNGVFTEHSNVNQISMFRCKPSEYEYVFAYDNSYLLPELAGQHELPFSCFSTLPSTGEVIAIDYGEMGYCTFVKKESRKANDKKFDVKETNEDL